MKKNPENLTKIIIPKKDDNKNQELLENLEAISDDDIMEMWEKIDEAMKKKQDETESSQPESEDSEIDENEKTMERFRSIDDNPTNVYDY